MALSQEQVRAKVLAGFEIYILTRAELLLNLCYEIPCSLYGSIYRISLNKVRGH